ncbi:MAG: hypothetical protein Q4F57_05810 [Weeksellaceae bacterium]|nr:hypothetical protein [Weeksellaceae bacterium]
MENPSLFRRILQTLGLASLLLKSEGSKTKQTAQRSTAEKDRKTGTKNISQS